MRVTLSLASLVCLSLLGAQRAAAGPPFPLKSNLQFDEKSPYAMVVFEAVPSQSGSWSLQVFAFSLETQAWTYGPLKGWGRFQDIRPAAEPTLHAALVKPGGTYAIARIGTQLYWHACFNGGTRAFPLEAGKVNYIGSIDPNPSLEQIFTDLPKKTTRPLDLYDTPRLQLTPPSQQPDWIVPVANFIATRFPKVHAPIVAQESVETTFKPASSIIAGKICEKY